MEIREFNNDDEFIGFAINVTPVFIKSNDVTFFDFDFTDDYKQCIENNIFFKINDIDSSIMKRKELNYRLVCKPVENLYEPEIEI